MEVDEQTHGHNEDHHIHLFEHGALPSDSESEHLFHNSQNLSGQNGDLLDLERRRRELPPPNENLTIVTAIAGVPAYSLDIRNLLFNFVKQNTPSFQVFKQTWKDIGFTVIHETKPEVLTATEHLQLLFQTTLGYFFVNRQFLIRTAVIYALYLLYDTQHNSPKVKITISLAMWQEIVKFIAGDEVIQFKAAELFHIYHHMKNHNYFLFSAIPPSIEGLVGSGKSSIPGEGNVASEMINIDTVNGVVDVDLIERISKEYAEAKTQRTIVLVNDEQGGYAVQHEVEADQSIIPPAMNVVKDLVSEVKGIVGQYNQEKMQRRLPQTLGFGAMQSTNMSIQSRASIRKKDYGNKTVDRVALHSNKKKNKTQTSPISISSQQIPTTPVSTNRTDVTTYPSLLSQMQSSESVLPIASITRTTDEENDDGFAETIEEEMLHGVQEEQANDNSFVNVTEADEEHQEEEEEELHLKKPVKRKASKKQNRKSSKKR